MAASNTLIVELRPISSPMQHELVTDPIDRTDGWVAPPERPGSGITVDEAVVARYRFSEAELGS